MPTEAAGVELQLFEHKSAAMEACRETGLEEREREIDANDGRVLPQAAASCAGWSAGCSHTLSTRPVSHPRVCPAKGRALSLTDGQLQKPQGLPSF